MNHKVVALIDEFAELSLTDARKALKGVGEALPLSEYGNDPATLASVTREAEITLLSIATIDHYPNVIEWIRSIQPLADIWRICPEPHPLSGEREYDEVVSKNLFLKNSVELLRGRLKRRLAQKATLKKVDIVARSQRMGALAETIERVAPTDVSALIVGPTGSGKEKIAHAIHQLSHRSEKPFVAVNCGAIPEGLIESELFGHEKGAFTGSVSRRQGYFTQADGGTIFLDEIGEMKIDMQVKLLRALEEGVFYPLGSEKPHKVNVRTLAATNRDLEQAILSERFRDDLYFRLAGVKLIVPALADRPEDIVPLIAHFSVGSPVTGYSEEALNLIEDYAWPGNVRQLKNFVTRMSAIVGANEVSAGDVRRYIGEHSFARQALPVVSGAPASDVGQDLVYRALLQLGAEVKGLRELILRNVNNPVSQSQDSAEYTMEENSAETARTLEDMEEMMLRDALTESGGNRRETARRLGIGERTLYRKLKKYGLG